MLALMSSQGEGTTTPSTGMWRQQNVKTHKLTNLRPGSGACLHAWMRVHNCINTFDMSTTKQKIHFALISEDSGSFYSKSPVLAVNLGLLYHWKAPQKIASLLLIGRKKVPPLCRLGAISLFSIGATAVLLQKTALFSALTSLSWH